MDKKANIRIGLIAFGILLIDQISKITVLKYLDYLNEKVILDGFFKFVHWGNTGAAWSVFRGNNELLAVIALVSTANTVLILLVSTSRLLYGVSKTEYRMFPTGLARVHARRRTPYLAVGLTGAVALPFVLLRDVGVVAGLTTPPMNSGPVRAARSGSSKSPAPIVMSLPGPASGSPMVNDPVPLTAPVVSVAPAA
jgi:amino acid transporter